ncbi:hypothetical protein J3F84DRAFT_374518 [Trichoderma pleuroticola]|uniref:Small EDRK-rich factor-like N-terminal domain-containing protein n=1 Tax=Trichoderma harzianum TaxID=5544 RepID=A0A2K0TTJ5_TRIHA|nr:hypothetical protein THARTR1_10271 [Trichoderma harzianum]
MARGNQRDLARAKNQKNASKTKGGNGENGYEQAKSRLSNAEIMRQKQAKGPNNQPYPMPVANQSTYQGNSRCRESRIGSKSSTRQNRRKGEEAD